MSQTTGTNSPQKSGSLHHASCVLPPYAEVIGQTTATVGAASTQGMRVDQAPVKEKPWSLVEIPVQIARNETGAWPATMIDDHGLPVAMVEPADIA